MRNRYLEATFRHGRMLAAYLYLPRKAGEKAASTVPIGYGLMVDYSAEGLPIGVEITRPSYVTIEQIDEVLRRLGLEGISADVLGPPHG